MKKTLNMLLISILLTACGGGNNNDKIIVKDSSTNSPGSNVVRTVPFSSGNECEAGGIQIDSGIDTNANGKLDDDEVDLSKVICNGATGYSSLIKIADESIGENCATGGKAINVGKDLNRNDVLDIEEISSTEYICNVAEGAKGEEGEKGIDGTEGIAACSVSDNNNGTKTLSCTDGTSVTISDGKDGTNGSSCSVADNGNGTKTISCTDGSSVIVSDGATGATGANGADGSSCSVKDNGDSTKTISCTDGSSVTVNDGATGAKGADGTSCTVEDNGDNTKTISCTDGSSVVVSDGAKGADGSSCSVNDNGDNTKTISCTDGSSVIVSNGAKGADGSSCSVNDNGDGTKTISCTNGSSVIVSDGATGATGANGADGSSCSVKDNGDSTKTISCTDGSSVTVNDGATGAKGADGTSCTVEDNSDNTKTISCTDGSSIVVSDGAKGADGSSCSVNDNGNGTKTISCTNGSNVIVSDGATGANGADGSSCSVIDNGDGTKTISCTDGSSVTVSDGISAIPRQPVFTNIVDCPTGDAVVYWNPDETPSAVSFKLYWRTSPSAPWNQNGPVPIEPPNYKHTNRDNSKTYEYFLTAVNSSGESAPSPGFNAAQYCPGDVIQDQAQDSSYLTPRMVVIPAESYVMGDETFAGTDHNLQNVPVGDEDEIPHAVSFMKPFAIGETEVTFNEFDLYLIDALQIDPSTIVDPYFAYDEGWGRGERPAIYISKLYAKKYVAWLNEKLGLTNKPNAYRLPTEAEWEYVARADKPNSAFGIGDGDCLTASIANWAHTGPTYFNYVKKDGTAINCSEFTPSLNETVEVKSYPSNNWGVFEMHGNAAEWVEDCYGSYLDAPTTGEAATSCPPIYSEPTGVILTSIDILRGGGALNSMKTLRSSERNPFPNEFASHSASESTGFRLARDL